MKLPERDRVRLQHMLETARKAVAFSCGRSRADLDADEMLAFALVRALEVIGEAAAQVAPETRHRLPDIPWRLIVGMRNRLIHGYDEVDLSQVWDTVEQYVPSLIQQLEEGLRPAGR
jgi:uncharacterized protein with HEPN domain